MQTTPRGYIQVDDQLRTAAPHIVAAGDITGRLMLVPHAVQDGYLAATNAVRNPDTLSAPGHAPIGRFTDPEYAQAGLTESTAGADHDVVVSTTPFAVAARPILGWMADRVLQAHRRAAQVARWRSPPKDGWQYARIPLLSHLHQRPG